MLASELCALRQYTVLERFILRGYLLSFRTNRIINKRTEQAIKENRENIKYRREQFDLRKIKKRRSRTLERYLVSVYSIAPYDNEELERYLNKNMADEKVRAKIVEAVKKDMEGQSEEMPKQRTTQ
jgi:hypothetical protein